MLDSTPAPSALITDPEIYRPSTGLLSLLLDARLINQASWLYFDVRSRTPQSQGYHTIETGNYWKLTQAQLVNISTQLYEGGLAKTFLAPAVSMQWLTSPGTPRPKDDLKELYRDKLLKLPDFIKEILSHSITTSSGIINWEFLSKDWGLKFSEFWIGVVALEKKRSLSISLEKPYIDLYWHTMRSPGFSRRELVAMHVEKILSDRGHVFLSCKAVTQPYQKSWTRTIDANILRTEWGVDESRLFEELASYQSRDIANLYLENLEIEWLDLPEYVPADKLKKRKGMYRQHGLLMMIIRSENPEGKIKQPIKISSISLGWKLKTQDIIRYLARLAKLDTLKADLSQLSIQWFW